MSDTNSEEPRQEFKDKYRKYLESLIAFRQVQQHFEDEIPRVSALEMDERGVFVLENNEDFLFGLSGRPKLLEMQALQAMLDGKNEFQTFCNALCIGWKLWPDWWAGLQMMLDYLSQNTFSEDLEGLDFSTLTVLKEIAKFENWPNNEMCGPQMMSPQAKYILIRFEHKCSFSGVTGISTLGQMEFSGPLSCLPNIFDRIASFRICDGLGCFKVETHAVKFKMCGKCRKMHYCSKDCQTAAWKGEHKKVCIRMSVTERS